MRSSIKLMMGAITSFLAIAFTRYLAYININIPLSDIFAIILVSILPGVIGGTFMLSAVAAAIGSTIGVLSWLILYYTPIAGEMSYISNVLSLEPTIGYITLLSVAFIVAGLIGHGISIYSERHVREEKKEAKEEIEEKAEEVIPLTKEKISTEQPSQPTPTSISLETPQIEEEIYTICKYCSEPVPEGASFCPHCGKKVK
ncbi:MAG: zinc ribbon domain-containing protein [Nitrososphaerota archaeon]